MPRPAMSGALPWTGSNSEGTRRVGLRFADGAMPIVPAQAGPRSDRMSPNRLLATTTSNQCGLRTKCAVRMSTWYWSTRTSGYSGAIAATRSSQNGIEIEIPLLLVQLVRCFFGRDRASSNANRRMRSTPVRVKTASCTTNSRSVPANIRPPTDEYSPSVFSRTTRKSISPGLRSASGHGTPGISRTGRRLTY